MFSGCAQCFLDLDEKININATSRINIRYLNVKVKQSAGGKYYLDGLNSAASKLRLAGSAKLYLDGYSNGTRNDYEAQFKLLMAAVALESYSKVFGSDSTKTASELAQLQISNEFSAFRNIISEGSIRKARDKLTQKALKDRLEKYINGNDLEIMSIVVAIRHCFAHGLIGSQLSCSPFGGPLAELTLDLIMRHCNSITAKI